MRSSYPFSLFCFSGFFEVNDEIMSTLYKSRTDYRVDNDWWRRFSWFSSFCTSTVVIVPSLDANASFQNGVSLPGCWRTSLAVPQEIMGWTNLKFRENFQILIKISQECYRAVGNTELIFIRHQLHLCFVFIFACGVPCDRKNYFRSSALDKKLGKQSFRYLSFHS
jgi:hypothetical protein